MNYDDGSTWDDDGLYDVSFPEFYVPGSNPGGLVATLMFAGGHLEVWKIITNGDLDDALAHWQDVDGAGLGVYFALYDGESGAVWRGFEQGGIVVGYSGPGGKALVSLR
jgi:hypothetical protein